MCAFPGKWSYVSDESAVMNLQQTSINSNGLCTIFYCTAAACCAMGLHVQCQIVKLPLLCTQFMAFSLTIISSSQLVFGTSDYAAGSVFCMLSNGTYAAGGKGAYGAIDAIGGAMSPKVVASLRKSGKYILYGALDTSPVSASNSDLLALTKVLITLKTRSLIDMVTANRCGDLMQAQQVCPVTALSS